MQLKILFFLSPLCAVVAVWGGGNSLSNCIGFVSLTGQSLCTRPKISLQSAGKGSALQEHPSDIPENHRAAVGVVSFLLETRQSWCVTLNQLPAPDVVHLHHRSADLWAKRCVDRA